MSQPRTAGGVAELDDRRRAPFSELCRQQCAIDQSAGDVHAPSRRCGLAVVCRPTQKLTAAAVLALIVIQDGLAPVYLITSVLDAHQLIITQPTL